MDPADYLSHALHIIQQKALRSARVDWVRVRELADAIGPHARTCAETYPLIRYALDALEDQHSFLATPERVIARNNAPTPSLVTRRMGDAIGYLAIPGIDGEGAGFADATHQAIQTLDEDGVRAWIIDLRRDTGGNMWPMIAAVGPILGEGHIGGFVAPGVTARWTYCDGASWCNDGILSKVEGAAYHLKVPMPPVAVLIGPKTASSGEAMVLAFAGRERTCTFGQPTHGVPTANEGFELPDGASLNITVMLLTDRTGRAYDTAIVPDELIADLDDGRDAALDAATAWLKKQSM